MEFSYSVATCFHVRCSRLPRFSFVGSRKAEPKQRSIMKTLLSAGAIVAFLGLASTYPQTQSTNSSTTYIETSKLVGRPVKSSQGEEIGTIKDVVIDRNTGCMAYTVLSTGGGGGRVAGGGGKMVAVPWSVYSPQSDLNTYTVTVERERIFNAPVFDYARIEEYSRPDYINNVYSYYGVSQGVGVGVGVSGGTSTTTTGAATTTTGAATSTGTQAGGAAANETGAGQGAPSPNTTEGRRAHPGAAAAAGAAAVRARETPTPSPYGRATGASPSKERTPGTKEKPEQATPSGRGKTETRSETERAPSEETTTGEKTKGSTRERSRSREATTPPERPQE
jgi:sporulation protein YlmC with PRC-barrel domain